MKIATLILFLLGTCTLAPGLAAGPANAGMLPPSDMKNLKLGLWEETIESQQLVQDIDPRMLKMEDMTPEQKARIEAVLKRQHTEHAAEGNVRKTTRNKRFCLKADDYDKSFEVAGDRGRKKDVDCTLSEGPRSASRVSFRSECTMPQGKVTSEVTYGVKSSTETYGEVVGKGTLMGRPQNSSRKMTAHWVAADCGKVTEGPR